MVTKKPKKLTFLGILKFLLAKLARKKRFVPREGMVMAVGWHWPFCILDEVPFTTIASLQQTYVIHSV